MTILERFKKIRRAMNEGGIPLADRHAFVCKTDGMLLAMQSIDLDPLLSDSQKETKKSHVLINGPKQNDMPIIYGIQATLI